MVPFRAGIELGFKGMLPRSHYIAVFDPGKCSYCGICMRRCQFGAWEHDGTTVKVNGKMKGNIVYNSEKCWSCGLRANTCPSDAITMKALNEPVAPLEGQGIF
jgi:ferredoxin